MVEIGSIFGNKYNMKYFRIGYCPPNPGPNSRIYGWVRAYNENEIQHAIDYALKCKLQMPIYMKPSYGAAYREITYERLLEYAVEIETKKK